LQLLEISYIDSVKLLVPENGCFRCKRANGPKLLILSYLIESDWTGEWDERVSSNKYPKENLPLAYHNPAKECQPITASNTLLWSLEKLLDSWQFSLYYRLSSKNPYKLHIISIKGSLAIEYLG